MRRPRDQLACKQAVMAAAAGAPCWLMLLLLAALSAPGVALGPDKQAQQVDSCRPPLSAVGLVLPAPRDRVRQEPCLGTTQAVNESCGTSLLGSPADRC